jgi:hypothetical protein
VVEAVLSLRIDDLKPWRSRRAYDARSLEARFDAKPAEIRRLSRGGLSVICMQKVPLSKSLI